MASSTPSSVKSEPAGVLYSPHDTNLSYTSIFDTSIDNTSTSKQSKTIPPPPSSSIPIDTSNSSIHDPTFDHFQGFSAPTLPVYINMGVNDQHRNVHIDDQVTTMDAPLSRSLTSIDVDRTIPQPILQRHSSHHPAHHSHHSQNRNRYPYLQRPTSSRAIHGGHAPRTSSDGLSYYEQRPAFRRSYFALRRQRIPKGTN